MVEYNYRNEEWKPITFHNLRDGERYEVSNYGRVRYFKKSINDWKINKNCLVGGYPYYSYFKTNRGWKHNTSKCVHKLVAEAFVHRPSEEHKYVIHLNFRKDDNYYKNLKWVTFEELLEHKRKNPYTKRSTGTKEDYIKNNKLTETEVMRLKKRLKSSKNPLYKIAKEFGISHTQLNRIRKGINWGHVKVD